MWGTNISKKHKHELSSDLSSRPGLLESSQLSSFVPILHPTHLYLCLGSSLHWTFNLSHCAAFMCKLYHHFNLYLKCHPCWELIFHFSLLLRNNLLRLWCPWPISSVPVRPLPLQNMCYQLKSLAFYFNGTWTGLTRYGKTHRHRNEHHEERSCYTHSPLETGDMTHTT